MAQDWRLLVSARRHSDRRVLAVGPAACRAVGAGPGGRALSRARLIGRAGRLVGNLCIAAGSLKLSADERFGRMCAGRWAACAATGNSDGRDEARGRGTPSGADREFPAAPMRPRDLYDRRLHRGARPLSRYPRRCLRDGRPSRSLRLSARGDCGDPAERAVAYFDTARAIEASGAQAIWLQHEYGIYGGPAGEHILALLDRTTLPVIVTLHTVLEKPSADERRVLEGLLARAARIVVMAERGREILQRVYGASPRQIVAIPHGVPDRALVDPATMKDRFGWAGRQVVLTFGLLAPSKGIETVISALPSVVERHADMLYVVLGATHPNLVAREGEAYRDRLKALAAEKGVGDNVRFVDAFVEHDELIDYLQAADVYVTPYGQPGADHERHVVLRGRRWETGDLDPLCPRDRDPGRRVRGVGRLRRRCRLRARDRPAAVERSRSQPARRARLRSRPHDDLVVPGGGYDGGDPCRGGRAAAADRAAGRESAPDFAGFCRGGADERCNGHAPARDLLDPRPAPRILHRRQRPRADPDEPRSPMSRRMFASRQMDQRSTPPSFSTPGTARTSAASATSCGYRPHMAARTQGSDDSAAAATIWALGVTALEAAARRATANGQNGDVRFRPRPASSSSSDRRGRMAFGMLGAAAMMEAKPGHEHFADRSWTALGGERAPGAARRAARRPDWPWFEAMLAYDNARLSEALIRAGKAIGRVATMVDCGLETLAWILRDSRHAPEPAISAPSGSDSFRPATMPGAAAVRPAAVGSAGDRSKPAPPPIDALQAEAQLAGKRRSPRLSLVPGRANDLGLPLVASPADGRVAMTA